MSSLKKLFYLICFGLLLLAGCSEETLEWYETEEKAVDEGLKQEGSEAHLLSVEQVKGESIVFFETNDTLAVASIAKSNKGYSWYRSNAYVVFEGNTDYSTMGFVVATRSGLKIPVMVGKVFDTNIVSMRLIEAGIEKELPILGESRFYYSIHEAPYEKLQISPIFKNEK